MFRYQLVNGKSERKLSSAEENSIVLDKITNKGRYLFFLNDLSGFRNAWKIFIIVF